MHKTLIVNNINKKRNIDEIFIPQITPHALHRIQCLQVTVSESNQPPKFLQIWKKVNFMCSFNTTYCVGKPYQKRKPSSINIIQTLLLRMEWFRSGLPNSVVVVRAQKSYQVQVVQIRSLHHK